MPQVRRSRKAPLDGCQLMEPMLDQLGQERREVEMEPHKGKKKLESLWPIFRIHHQKTIMSVTIIFSAKIPSPGFLSWVLHQGGDKNLIAQWKKQGCGNFCCLHCIQTWDSNFGTNCSCRVPKNKLEL
ncbi:BUD31 protein, partial [Loxia leucoptera]|nr:BUD31 protein [Loxia leucoptera]